MNKCVIIGRLTKDVELRYSQGGVAISTFTLAVDRRFKNKDGQKEADFIQIKAFKQLGELCANYLSKGKMAAISGALQISSYTDKDGNKKYSTDIIAEDVQFLSPKGEGEASVNPSKYGNEVSLDSDIPF
jgi:single-strand DNA-binding protein